MHVEDLARAHLLALDRTVGGRHEIYNLGTGSGHSVSEVVATARRVTGREIPVQALPRRIGDPPRLVAANGRAREVLGWRPERTLEDMIRDAWAWHRSHPDGYANPVGVGD